MGKKSEQGNVIELVIIGVLVLVIGGLVAWRFMDTGQKAAESSTDTTTSSGASNNTAVKSELGYEGVRITTKNGAFSIAIPNGWKMTNALNDDNITSGPVIDYIRYDASKSPEITEAGIGGWGGYSQHFYALVPYAPYSGTGTAESITLNDGTIAKKYHTVIAKGTTSEGFGTLDDTYNTYDYVITKGSRTVEAHFAIFDKTEYDRSIIDNVVKSIEIK